MKKRIQKLVALLLAVTMVIGMAPAAFADDSNDSPPVAVSLNDLIQELTNGSGALPNSMIDRTRIIEQPEAVQGYFTHFFPATNAVGAKAGTGTTIRPELADRTFKLYISERAPLRTYLTVIAVPNGVDTTTFLYEEGWFEQADKYGEILFALEPNQATKTWGTPEEEASYLAACLEELIGNTGVPSGSRTANTRGVIGQENIEVYVRNESGATRSIVVATAHSTSYYVGYGAGAKVLESFTSNNPLRVISQAFIDGESAGSAILNANAARVYNGVSTTTYQPGENDEAFKNTLQTISDNGGKFGTDFMTNADIPVPTLLAGAGYAGSASLDHWKLINDTKDTAEDGVYWQRIDSDTWATDYANQNIKRWDPDATNGISQVRTTGDTSMNAEELRDFLAQYTRFTWQWAYSNHLNYRLDYLTASKAARETAAANAGTALPSTTYTRRNGDTHSVELHAVESTPVGVSGIDATKGTVYSTMFSYARYSSGSGPNEAREALIYVPDSAKTKYPDGAPMVIVYPGMTHAPITFMDASHWWGVASDEGLIVVIVGENYTSPVALNHTSNDDSAHFARSLLRLLDEGIVDIDAKYDPGRIYAAGHSAGCSQATTLAVSTESYFAGVAGTSFPSAPSSFTADMMPIWVFMGQFDTGANNSVEPWANNNTHIAWLRNAWKMNDLEVNYPETGTAYSQQQFIDSTSKYDPNGRFFNYFWNNKQDIPLVGFTRTLCREHNCYPEEFRMAWDFLKKYSVNTATGQRYYSASGYANSDTVVIGAESAVTPLELTTATAVAKPGESNQLPLQGYYKANLTTAGYTDREIRYYIPETAVLRPYFHFIAVPDGVNVDEFVVSSGWKQVADETGECLYLLMPKDGTWGSTADEKGYIAAARTYHGTAPKGLTTFGMFYLTGYAEGAAPLEAWAAENPHLIIAQSYVDATASAGTAALEAAGSESFGWRHMTDGDYQRYDEEGRQRILLQMTERLKDSLNPDKAGYEGLLTKGDMPIPTWLVNAQSDSLAYWKKVNKAPDADSEVESFADAPAEGDVFEQKEDAWPTEYAGRISKVTAIDTSADTASHVFASALRDAMTVYTRYDNSLSYGNGLTYRLDYTPVQVARFASANTAKKATGTVTGKDLDGVDVDAEVTIALLRVQNSATATVPADMILYVPETAPSENIPVVVINHGASQNAHLFFDSTAWWQTAAKEGFAVLFTTRTGMGGTGAPSAPSNLPLFDAIYEYLKDDGRFDMTRVYASGQSAGGGMTISLTQDRTDFLAAAYAHNAPSFSVSNNASRKPIPFGLFIGDGNYSLRGIPGYSADTNASGSPLNYSTAAADAGADIYWDNTSGRLYQSWADYYTGANGVDNSNLSSVIKYRGASSLNGGVDKEGTLSEFDTNNARFRTFTWYKDKNQTVPVVEYSFSLFNAHNNIQGYGPFMWDYMKHFKVVDNHDGTVTRYYSPSAFESDDAVVIGAELEADILALTTGAHLVKKGDYFTLNASFVEEQSSNAAVLTYTFDGDKFEYANFTPAEGTQVVNTVYEKGIAKITVISKNYDLQNVGDIMLRAKEDAQLKREYQSVTLDAEYVVKDEEGGKIIETASANISFTTTGPIDPDDPDKPFVDGDTNGDGVVDLIDLSNMIDWFGFDDTHSDWTAKYVFFDFNNSGDIDIYDISYVARLIK